MGRLLASTKASSERFLVSRYQEPPGWGPPEDGNRVGSSHPGGEALAGATVCSVYSCFCGLG